MQSDKTLSKQTLPKDWFELKQVPSKTGKHYMISVPKRVIALSTRRSRIKRLIREAMRSENYAPQKGKRWMVMVKNPVPTTAKAQDVKKAIQMLIRNN